MLVAARFLNAAREAGVPGYSTRNASSALPGMPPRAP